jgi:hypothetical protein
MSGPCTLLCDHLLVCASEQHDLHTHHVLLVLALSNMLLSALYAKQHAIA